MRLAVTGANGWIGRALCTQASARGLRVRALVRHSDPHLAALPGCEVVNISGLQRIPELREALQNQECIIHLAARVHVMRETAADPLAAFREANVNTTQALAQAAQAVGVRRLVLLSSIKVNGESTQRGHPLTEADAPAPQDAYGQSKWEAEQALWAQAQHGLQGVVLRPPLVYGPGVRANFDALVRVVRRGWPLPLAAIDNRRSLIGLHNLVDALLCAASHPAAAGQTFLVSDGQDLSTPELVRAIAAALHRPARLWPVPPALLRAVAHSLGRAAAIERLCGDLQIDSRRITQALGWTPPQTLAQGLHDLARTHHTLA
ncbi:MAG: SDR family oxidoreductase [Rhodoferax sp.]